MKESRIENKNESQWAEHMASFTCERAELDTRFMYLIRQPIVILARNNSCAPTSNPGVDALSKGRRCRHKQSVAQGALHGFGVIHAAMLVQDIGPLVAWFR